MDHNKLIITPRTRIYDLLEAYPQLENVLLLKAPQFKKLQNPVLRRTITRITSLSQAAIIGGLKVEELVNSLRREVGQDESSSFESAEQSYITNQPDWFSQEKITIRMDIRDMLNKGDQPVHEVLAVLTKLPVDQILEVTAPFIPAPLIDKSLSLDFNHWLLSRTTDEHMVYFTKQS